jgi:hypothetical protein
MYSGESKYSIFNVISSKFQILSEILWKSNPKSGGKRKIRQASFQRIDISDEGFLNKFRNKGGSLSSIQDDGTVLIFIVRKIY